MKTMNKIENYTPCRVTEIYYIAEDYIEVVGTSGVIVLKGVLMDLWYKLDGLHTIGEIVNDLCMKFLIVDRSAIINELFIILKKLQRNNLVIINWDPLYKFELKQDLDGYET